MIHGNALKEAHRTDEKAFSRERKLTFSRLLIIMLRKSVKSLQLMLNEVSDLLAFDAPVSNAAYCKARQKLKASAFVELNRKAVVEVMYADKDYQHWNGFRVIANDGSQIRLPNSPDILEAFGSVSYTKTAGKHAGETGQHAYARVSVAYDVLNRVAIDARIDGATAYEVTQTIAHLEHGQAGDLWLHDRGYASYELIAHHHQRQNHFLIRCSKGSFATARKMLNGQGKDSQITTLHAPATKRATFKKAGLPTSVKVRFVRVQLDTGEYEVLVTDLLDEERYLTEDFAELYWQRWGVETFYSVLKTRLNLENFTGLTAESVRQDFHSSVFLCGLESILTQDTQEQLDRKNVKHPQQVNRMVSFNAIKNHAFELFYSDTPIDEVVERLSQLFLRNPTCARTHRKPPRTTPSPRQEIDYLRRKRKYCF